MIKLANTHARLVDTLGRMIANGEIGKDGLLPREDDLVEQFGLSRTVVREATKTLQALGLVVTRPRIGSRIQPVARWRLLDPQVMQWVTRSVLTPGFIRDLLDLRAMIEPSAAAFAAERATAEQRQEIAAALDAMSAASTKASHVRADFAFHEAILRASHNALLMQLAPALHAVLEGSFRLSMHDKARIRASISVHREVAEAIIAGDSAAAQQAMNGLLQVARRDIEQQTEQDSRRKRAGRPAGAASADQLP
ncbi:DNA-binding transcriptional regulator, FadR family [Bosea sp. OK403]|uniref:FadR/GntR family transcriptional regulator n=1 Tax=Bosea sp. OK403 TaxID=1855286 RepID=UPI0008DEF001|nr:FCD domain-containing protein [Bosea sp. OK403]SFJ77574.1 DNA-binding transcriptional regulator, FadR family [Bosea sp. OK403]